MKKSLAANFANEHESEQENRSSVQVAEEILFATRIIFAFKGAKVRSGILEKAIEFS